MLTSAKEKHPQPAEVPGYVSEFERFMGDYLDQHPQVLDSQHAGWLQYWDRDVDFEELKEEAKDSVPFHGYDYF